MAARKLKKEQSAERESPDTGKVNEEDEERLYGNIDDYKHLIQDEMCIRDRYNGADDRSDFF